MLSPLRTITRERPPGEAGFTLVELCVAMGAALVVIIGLTSIMIGTVQQTQRIFTKVDATQQARTALADLENELHSACVGGEAPIQGAGSRCKDIDVVALVVLPGGFPRRVATAEIVRSSTPSSVAALSLNHSRNPRRPSIVSSVKAFCKSSRSSQS